MSEINVWWDDDPIELEAAISWRIFSVEKNDDGTFRLWEQCDMHYYIDVSKEQLIELGQRLIDKAKGNQ